MRERGDGGEHLPRRRRQAAQPRIEHALERLRDRQRVRRRRPSARVDQRPADLEPVQRVAPGRGMDPKQQRAGQPQVEPRSQQRVQLARLPSAPTGTRTTRNSGPASSPSGSVLDAPTRRASKASTRSPVNRRRANVNARAESASSHCTSSTATTTPPHRGEVAQGPEHRERDRTLVGHLTVRIGHEQRNLQRAPLRRRECATVSSSSGSSRSPSPA